MAYYGALVSLVQLLKDIIHQDRYPNFLLDKHQLHASLYAKFNLLLDMLDDYSPKYHKDKSNDIVERRIRDATYCAQDIIESHISTPLVPHVHLEKRVPRHLGSTFPKPLYYIAKKKYCRDLEKVKTEVDSIVEELIRIKVESNTTYEDMQPNPYTSAKAPSGRNTMLVFDNHLMTAIKGQLSGESSKLEVISISGMGGLGKTTLASNIFNDKFVHDRFDCRAWVIVSQNYNLKTLLLSIINSLNITEEELPNEENVFRQYLYQNLFGRRYLIVMDDVWETRFWDDIRRIFPDNSNGSRIMITTRLFDVANHASSSTFRHQIQFLNKGQSWSLLRKKVFAQEHCPKELESVGKEIAKNCRGLPLAIVVIAGVLSNIKRELHDWKNIARKVSSTAIDQNDEHLSALLSLSYNHLPHHLKPCFLYLGGYPEDHEVRISKLIRLWVAEGFLKPTESKSLEEVGEEYFKDLVSRNLVLITQKKSNGKSKFCTIHDVLRELCSQIAQDENFLLCVQRKGDFQRVPIKDVRRVYIQINYGSSEILEYIKKHGSHVRSFICCSPQLHYEDDSLSAACGCKFLRILDPGASIGFTASKSLAKLLQLRYLNLVSHPVPSRIFQLQNLQTLIFDTRALLPFEIWKMPQLRHVMSKKGVELLQIPYEEIRMNDGVPLLGNLQTLSRVIDFRFSSDTIEMFPSLKKLGFESGYLVKPCWEDNGLNNLVHLHQLETLYFSFRLLTWMDAIPLPENFAFPSTLIKLTLSGCNLPWKDMSAVGSLPNLQVLKLRQDAFLGEEWEPIEGEFLELKFLEMERLYDLKYWQAETTHFPRLEQLRIILCNALKEIPPGIGDIPTLQLIEVHARSSNLKSSALKIQEDQRDLENDDLQVRVYSY